MATHARQQYFADESSLSKERREFSIADEIQEKIDSVEEGAQVNRIDTIKVNGTALVPDTNKAVNINVPDVIDNLYTVDSNNALSAKQGKILYDYIQNLLTIGRFLSNWDSATGLPITNPSESPYIYKAGDYYRVSNVATSPATNYKPDGSSFIIGQASTTVETSSVSVSDLYLYDGTSWILLSNSGSGIAVDSSLSTTSTNPVENRVITNALNGKQEILIAGNNIQIAADGKTISATDTTYTAGANISIDANNQISATDTTYTAGTGISIDANNVISNTQTSAEWGNITGDISDQIDLMNLIDAKQDLLTSENAGRDIEIVNGPGGDETVSGNTSILLEKALADGLNSVTISGGIKQNYLPEGYTEYEYIHTTNQYFITDYYPNNKTEVKTKVFMDKQPGSAFVTRWAGTPTNDTFGVYMGNVEKRMTFYYGAYNDNRYIHINDISVNTEHDIYMGVSSIILDGVSNSISRATFTSTEPLYIGAFNQVGGTIAGTLTGRIYKIEIIENGNVVRRYIPCKNANDEIGLYESVSGTFLSKLGTGSLKAGKIAENLNSLPSEYTRLDYIQSTGTQYIDTGITANFANNKIEQTAVVEFTTSSSTRELMGTNGYGFWGKSATNKIEAALGSITVSDSALAKNVVNWTTDPTDSNTLTLNVNSNQYTSTASSFVDADYAYYIFALGIRVGSGASASFLCKAKVYRYAISKDDEVVCDLIPCQRNSDSALGMYDLVRGVFLTNAGTGTFTAGNVYSVLNPDNPMPIISNNGELKVRHQSGLPLGYTKLEYIQSTGTQYINTGILTQNNIGFDVTFLTNSSIQPQPAEGTFGAILGGRKSSGTHDFQLTTYTPTGSTNGTIRVGSSAPIISAKISTNTRLHISLINNVITYNDGTTLNVAAHVYPSSGTSIYLFGLNNNGEFVQSGSGCTIYEAKLLVGSEVVFNGIPARRNSDNVLGMYDTVTNTFLTNAGTGTFTAGNDVTDPVGIYADGDIETITDELNNTATAEMLLSISDYTDTQELLTGLVTRKVGVIALNGTESWAASPTAGNYYLAVSDALVPTSNMELISTHYVGTSLGASVAPNNSIKLGTNTLVPDTGLIYIKQGGFTSVDDFKIYLTNQYANGTPVIVVYPLATETTESVTGQTLTTIEGDNTLTITQASIDNLPIEANYDKIGGLTINFVNDDGFITESDLSGYQTISNMVTSLSGADNTHYPTAKAVADAIEGIESSALVTTQPTTPSEGAVYYDTTNDVVKVYDGTNWNVVGDDSADINTKTFYLSSSSDLVNAQAGLDWYLAGKNPIFVLSNNGRALTVYDVTSTKMRIIGNIFSSTAAESYTNLGLNGYSYTISNGTIVSSESTTVGNHPVLDPTHIYSTPYTPQYDGSPATKKYVDDTVASAKSSGATAPSNPTEGQLWYDTTNDVLKVYDGTNWNVVGDDAADINTKTFYLSSTSDLTNAQAAYDWYLAGKNPIIQYKYSGKTYPYTYILEDNGTSSKMRFKSTHLNKVDAVNLSYVNQFYIEFTISSGNVTEISNSTMEASPDVLATNVNYSTPYTPLYDGSPATKKYVDDSITGLGLGTAATKDTGTSSGNVPVLDSNGHLASSTLPGVALTDTFTVSTSSDLTTLSSAEQGDIAIVTSENKTYVLSVAPYSTASNWKQILSPTGGVTSVNGQTGAVTLSIPTKTSDITNDSGYITSSDIPTDVSDFNNDAGYLTSSTGVTSVNGSTGAVTVQATISDLATIRSGASAGATALQPNDNISELTNDVGYITDADVTPPDMFLSGDSDNELSLGAMFRAGDENNLPSAQDMNSNTLYFCY